MSNVIWANSVDELDDIINNNEVVVVKFTAPSWCVPCQQFAPHFDKAADTLDNITFVGVDVDDNPWAMTEFGVRGVPTVLRYVGGESNVVKSRAVVPLIKEITTYDG